MEKYRNTVLKTAKEHPLVYDAITDTEIETITILRKVGYEALYDSARYLTKLKHSAIPLRKPQINKQHACYHKRL
jgi:hypothetical protein